MQLAFTEDQEELRRTARAFLAEHASSERVRSAMASELGWDAEAWKRIATELGWTAVAIPEQHGGAGLGFVELIAILEEMGESLVCAPFFSTVCLAAPALLAAGDAPAAREWLPAIAEGRATATLLAGDRAQPAVVAARRRGDG
ncbi:MAG: acyl-CoA dehydrogenase, partial [Proteobacteria bacterium]